MKFSIRTGETTHLIDAKKALKEKPSGLKTWLYEYANAKLNRAPATECPSPTEPSFVRPSTPSRSSAVKRLSTSSGPKPDVVTIDAVNEAFKLDIVKSRLCPFPLVINVEDEAELLTIADKIHSSTAYNEMMVGLKLDSSKQNYPVQEKHMAERLVPVLEAILERTNNNSQSFINLKEKVIQFDDDIEKPNQYSAPTYYLTKPDITLVPTETPESKIRRWGIMTSAIELKCNSSEDLSTNLLYQISQYVLAMVHCRPFSSVTYVMTITGNIARIYRFDAQSFCLTDGALITDPEGFKTFCKYVAFMAHPNRQRERFRPRTSFTVQCQDGSQETYWSVKEEFKVLFHRLSLFGSRTVCFSGEAQKIISIQNGSKKTFHAAGDPIHVIIKLTWVAPRLVGHELNVLRHLQESTKFKSSPSWFKVPRPLGILHDYVDEDFRAACNVSTARSDPYKAEDPLQCVSLVTTSLEGKYVDQCRSLLEIVMVFKNLGQILLDVAKTGVQYRDFNLGNILRTGNGHSSDCLLIDFGNSRIQNKPRGSSEPSTLQELAQDDFQSCTEAFCSITSHEAAELTNELFDLKYKLQEAEASNNSFIIKVLKPLINRTESILSLYVLNHFDDLQSVFFVFLYVLVKKSVAPDAVVTSLAKKKKLFTIGIQRKKLVGVKSSVCDEMWSLMEKLSNIVKPETRTKVLKKLEKLQDKSSLTKVEKKCFKEWEAAFDTTLLNLSQLKTKW